MVYFRKHKYIKVEKEEIDMFYDTEFSVRLDSIMPVVVNVLDEELDCLDKINDKNLEKKLEDVQKKYYDFLIALNVMETLFRNVNKHILNRRLYYLFQYYNNMDDSCNINDVEDMLLVLTEGFYYYKEQYYNCLNGVGFDKNNLSIKEIDLIEFLNKISECLNIDNYFSIIFDCSSRKNVDSIFKRVIDQYMEIDCNNVINMNVLCSNSDLYTDENGNLKECRDNCSIVSVSQYRNYCSNVDSKDVIGVAKKLILEKKNI